MLSHYSMKKHQKVIRPFIRQVRVPLYKSYIFIILADSLDNVHTAAEKLHACKLDKPSPFSKARMAYDNEGYMSLWFKRGDVNHEAIGHEVSHVTGKILQYHGIALDPFNDEPFCYLSGWIQGWVYRALAAAKETVHQSEP